MCVCWDGGRGGGEGALTGTGKLYAPAHKGGMTTPLGHKKTEAQKSKGHVQSMEG